MVSPWRAQPAARRDAIESLDNFAPLRNKLRFMAEEKEEWAGIPIPIDGEDLIINPSYPWAKALGKQPAKDDPDHGTLRNRFWSTRHRCDIYVFEKDGTVDWGFVPGVHHLDYDLRTLGCSFAWGIEQEAAATQLLATMVKHIAFKQYLLTGTFLETSPRSHITYMFRRLKPTVAIKARNGKLRIMCTLCMHPIAYYANSWAGAMTPTDDVIAHLSLMRGDEAMYWRRCNQHAAHRPEAGL